MKLRIVGLALGALGALLLAGPALADPIAARMYISGDSGPGDNRLIIQATMPGSGGNGYQLTVVLAGAANAPTTLTEPTPHNYLITAGTDSTGAADPSKNTILVWSGLAAPPDLVLSVQGNGSDTLLKAIPVPPQPITGVNLASGAVTIAADLSASLTNGDILQVTGSTGNDGQYAVESVEVLGGSTIITIQGSIPDPLVNGSIASLGFPPNFSGGAD